MADAPYVLTRDEVIGVLTEAASRALREHRATHPVDIANAIMFSVEHAADAIDVLHSRGILDWER